MSWKYKILPRVVAILVVLMLIVPTLVACNNDDETPISTVTKAIEPAKTVEPTTQPTALTTTKTPKGPIKMGVIGSWTGAGAIVGTALIDPVIDLIKDELKERGGILGGHSVEFIKYDDKSSVAGSVGGIRQFADDDSVPLALFGGSSAAAIHASADEAERLQMPFLTYYTSWPEDMKLYYTIGVGPYGDYTYGVVMDAAYELKPKTIAFFGLDDYSARELMQRHKQEAESRGIEIVYDVYYDAGTVDFSPYLTRIKYADPDVLILLPIRPEGALGIYKQVADLGGWGDIRVLSPNSNTVSASKISTCEGTIVWITWVEGIQTPAGKAFEQAWVKKYGKLPFHDRLAHMYVCIWTAIHAIELADSTDRDEIVKAAHSGNLAWETPLGPVTINTEGMGYFDGYLVQIRDGKPVLLK